MAQVAVILRVLPSSIDVSLDDLKAKIEESLPQGYEVKSSGVEPIAFGLKALKLVIAMPEETEGGTEALEQALRSLPEVDEVEIEAVHRLS
jgi:elongation factor 1-beta